jgi:energy-coupling factor transporter ATP-binding protein EcfA2
MTITRGFKVHRSPRVHQLAGIFDVPLADEITRTWEVELKLPDNWNIGLITGPSMSGKSVVARELFGAHLVESWPWPADRSIVDGFPADLSIKEILALLGAVGFSSPPDWLKPYAALSTGGRFRVDLARTLAETPADGIAVVDEYTSVVDRTVAQIGSAALAKAVRSRGSRFVAVTCHHDVTQWLQPDWVYQLPEGKLDTGPFGAGGSSWRLPASVTPWPGPTLRRTITSTPPSTKARSAGALSSMAPPSPSSPSCTLPIPAAPDGVSTGSCASRITRASGSARLSAKRSRPTTGKRPASRISASPATRA